ncbi:MAG TPA: hypothetical protein VG893_15605 [Terracidiphilus sp.]|nr:hypothetical protein [Terracidiphilus sp.]
MHNAFLVAGKGIETGNRALPAARRLLAGRNLLCLPAAALLLVSAAASGQVLTIDTKGGHPIANGQEAGIDRRFAQIQPTHVDLPGNQLDSRTRYELLRFLQADQGFAMRPFPRGHKGLTLEANGKLDPAGEAYVSMVTAQGLSAKPGDRVVITDVKIERAKIILLLNGGPDLKHRFLRHIELGGGTVMTPVVQDDGQEATGARLTLTFRDHVPELTGKQVEALLEPLISFEVKTPIQAFTDTLPPKLRQAILNHNVLVGMNTDMVLFAKGRPERKVREMDGQMPFEEWIYGKPPEDVEFVRINGNRVIRVEVAKMGQTPVIFTKDEVEGMMRTDGTPAVAEAGVRTVEMGDVPRNPDTQAPAAPPSLRNPGETLPTDNSKDSRVGVMKPVEFPRQGPDEHPVAHQGDQPQGSSGAGGSGSNSGAGSAAAQQAPAAAAPPADASQASPPSTAPAPAQPQPQR